jgi:flagellar protein FliS
MQAATYWKSYREIATRTAPPGQLVLMLFDGALKFMERAITGFDCQEPKQRNETIHNNLQRAVDIIRVLNGSLNLEAGGKLAETLRNLYNYFDERIVESNLRKQREGITEVIGHMTELRNAWEVMLSKRGQEDAPQEEADGALLSALRAA